MQFFQISRYFDILSKCQKLYTRQLEPVCWKWELTRNEVDVLLFLYNNPQFDRAADIVARRGMTKSHVSLSVAGLAQKGLLERLSSPEDRRTVRLKLLGEGAQIAAEARQAQEHFFLQLYQGISPEELELFDTVTRKVFQNIEELSM